MIDPSVQAKNRQPLNVVLVNYKTAVITKICLELLRESLHGRPATIWVVDNDSADASLDYLRSLDWIQLIERRAEAKEPGYIAHGRALDLVLEKIDADYLFLMHSDTLIYDASIFDLMLAASQKDPALFAAGCLEQINRGAVRSIWRLTSRFAKHYIRRVKKSLGLSSRAPKPPRELYLKSFFALWNAKLIKQHNLHFAMNDELPGYAAQAQMLALGYRTNALAPRRIFKYLEHIQSGTVAASGNYGQQHRRTKAYQRVLRKYLTNGHAGEPAMSSQ